LPGYAFIAALFPEAGESPVDEEDAIGHSADGIVDVEAETDESEDNGDRSGIDGIERVALAFGTSIAIVPLLGLVLNFTPWGIRLTPIMVTVAGFTLGATAVAARRRWALPVDEQFSVPYREWIDSGRSELFEPETRLDGALNVLLVVSVLLAVSSVAYAVAVPPQGEQFSEFYLLTENEDGELVADGYPSTFVRGESASVVVGIGNNEYESTNYTVVVELQRVEAVDGGNLTANGTANATTELRVVDRERLGELSAQLEHNETWQDTHELQPTMTGQNLRVQYLLYRGEPPAEPTRDNAYRSLHLWVDVFETESERAAAQA
jgi:Predicted membrane protein